MLVGFTGVPGAGKTYSSKFLVKKWKEILTDKSLECSYNTVYSFSDPIKNIAKLLFPTWGEEHLRGELKDTDDPTYEISPRKVQQIIGKSLMEINTNLWPEYLFRKLDRNDSYIIHDLNIVAIDDVRFDHDFNSIKDRGGVMIGIIPGKNPPVSISESSINYVTESRSAELAKNSDFVLINNYDDKYLKDLEEIIETIISKKLENKND